MTIMVEVNCSHRIAQGLLVPLSSSSLGPSSSRRRVASSSPSPEPASVPRARSTSATSEVCQAPPSPRESLFIRLVLPPDFISLSVPRTRVQIQGNTPCDLPILGHGRDLILEDRASRTKELPGSQAVDKGDAPERRKRIPTAAVLMSAGLPWREAEGRGVPSRGPHPLADLRRVLEVLPRVSLGPGDRSLQFGNQGRSTVVRPTFRPDTLQGLHRQVVAAHAVENDHVEWGRRGALLVEAANVEAVDIDVPVHDLVNRALVTVEGEDDLLVGGEELDEACLGHPMRVELPREEGHQIHDVDDAHLELGRMLAQPVRRS